MTAAAVLEAQMPINIFTVEADLNENGWKLVSNTYKNLQTPLIMICPMGHEQEQTYSEWRKNKRCEKCFAGEQREGSSNDGIDHFTVLALDAATNTSGYSVFEDGVLIDHGIFRTNSSLNATGRINQAKKIMIEMINKYNPNLVGVENVQFQIHNNVELYRVLANLQGVIADTCYEMNVPFSLAYSTEWRKYCGIGGKDRAEKKLAAQAKVKMWYDISCGDDEADAICLGKYFANNFNRE